MSVILMGNKLTLPLLIVKKRMVMIRTDRKCPLIVKYYMLFVIFPYAFVINTQSTSVAGE